MIVSAHTMFCGPILVWQMHTSALCSVESCVLRRVGLKRECRTRIMTAALLSDSSMCKYCPVISHNLLAGLPGGIFCKGGGHMGVPEGSTGREWRRRSREARPGDEQPVHGRVHANDREQAEAQEVCRSLRDCVTALR